MLLYYSLGARSETVVNRVFEPKVAHFSRKGRYVIYNFPNDSTLSRLMSSALKNEIFLIS